ncbi:40S ribosomal protein S5-1 [Hordeum vulgare]|nr:40S ribosomal protein S5-1 [Hordeum vulgare]
MYAANVCKAYILIAMAPSSSSKEKFYEKFINPYLSEVMKHPQTIEMREGVLHIWDVQGPKKEGSEKARLATVEHDIFNCQGMVEWGPNANHAMIMDFIREHKMDNKDIVEMILKLHDRLQYLQA